MRLMRLEVVTHPRTHAIMFSRNQKVVRYVQYGEDDTSTASEEERLRDALSLLQRQKK